MLSFSCLFYYLKIQNIFEAGKKYMGLASENVNVNRSDDGEVSIYYC